MLAGWPTSPLGGWVAHISLWVPHLRHVFVANPYARELTFQDAQIRTRRDHMKYLTLIRTIALLHQHPRKTVEHRGLAIEYIEVELADIAVANRLAHEVLGRSLDELPPQTRRLLLAVDEMVAAGCQRGKMERSDFRFSRRDVRAHTGWGDTQLKVHLHRPQTGVGPRPRAIVGKRPSR